VSEIDDTCSLWVVAVPSNAVREVAERLPSGEIRVLVASKGLEVTTAKRMSEVISEARPGAIVAALSGPNLALEVANGVPSATVVASANQEFTEWVRDRLMSRSLRVYSSRDVIGVELGGALKNVLAIGAGMSDGLAFGDNTKAAFLCRGLSEMTSLGVQLGADASTFVGLSGIGDLIATAASRLSRNYRVGRALGEGIELDRALNEVGQVAEGVPTSFAAVELANRTASEVPLMRAIHDCIRGTIRPIEAVGMLMERAPRAEF
jgi:glycerol-3-phosphate dehydrogenase (NAD(P)+)